MSELKYRLLSGDDPQGRQKIYFCCHPEDFEVTFDLLCEDIFSRAENCAIYYEADPHGSFDREELLFQLGEMQLIVVPVTRRLLDEPSRAMELELPFAFGALTASDGKTRHIPVLPVLFGDDLKADFRATALFKDVQYLNRFAEDKTALSYDEKTSQIPDIRHRQRCGGGQDPVRIPGGHLPELPEKRPGSRARTDGEDPQGRTMPGCLDLV